MKAPAPTVARTVLSRAVLFFGLWLVLLPSLKPADLAVGLIATAAATWTSAHLMPPEVGHVRLLALLAFVPHFAWQSVMAGVDVARRAMSPRMRLKPGFVTCPVSLPPGSVDRRGGTTIPRRRATDPPTRRRAEDLPFIPIGNKEDK